MEDTVVVGALRTPVGRKGKGLSGVHPATLLGQVQQAVLDRTGVDPAQVGHIVGGCVDQVGEQTFNIARTAWLSQGLPETVAATTVDAQCGSSQEAFTLAAGLVRSGLVDVALACGVESMSRIPIGSPFRKEFNLGRPVPKPYLERYKFLNQYQAAEAIAKKWNVSREAADRFGVASQERAAQAWAEDRFAGQIVDIDNGEAVISRDEGLRDTSYESVAKLDAVVPDGIHTAATASQISDGAGAVLLASASVAERNGWTPLARVVDSMLVGVDPVMMLTGPHEVTPKLLERTGLKIDDFDNIEINEAFASIVLSWADEVGADLDKVNPNGGAIALGHPLGATGSILITKAVHELQRTSGRYSLVTMCCGGGLGTGTILERV